MPTVQLVLICVTVLLLAVITAAVLVQNGRPRTLKLLPSLDDHRRVIVHRRDSDNLEGLLVGQSETELKLDDVTILTGGQKVETGRRWYVPTADVEAVEEL